jgi:hypothetical protein
MRKNQTRSRTPFSAFFNRNFNKAKSAHSVSTGGRFSMGVNQVSL